MTQATAPVSLNGSRLVRFLSDLSVAGVEVSHKHFAERLGGLIDLSDSISLSTAHGGLSAMAVPAPSADGKAAAGEYLRQEFLDTHTSAVQFIIKSFVADGAANWLKLPSEETSIASIAKYDPYLQFYSAHQREMDFKVKRLRADVRTTISDLSPKLAQLSTLDEALEKTLSTHSRKLFAGVPRLLEQRFHFLLVESESSSLGVANLGDFYKEMQGLLLAELEIRLQPVLGLIEALNEEIDTRYE